MAFDDKDLDPTDIDLDSMVDAEPSAEPEPHHDIDAQVDEVLRDIELNSSSTYALRSSEVDVEELSPDDIHSDDLVDDDDMEEFVEADLAEEDEVDELPEAIEVVEETIEEEPEEEEVDEEELEERAEQNRRHLRNFLILGIIILLVLAGTIGVFMWRNSISSNVSQSDTEALNTGAAGTHTATFHDIAADRVPDLAKVFGMTPDEAVAACNGQLTVTGTPAAAADPEVPALTQLVNATVADTTGRVIASVALGMDKDIHIVYIYSAFDLDSLDVSDATFEELTNSSTIASSLLRGVGIPDENVKGLALDVSKDANAVKSTDKSAKEQAEFKGSTGLAAAPMNYKLTETYDHAVGKTLGDNSVMRTLLIELW